MHDIFYLDFGTHTELRLQNLKYKKEIPTMDYNSYINHFNNRNKHYQLAKFSRSSPPLQAQKKKNYTTLNRSEIHQLIAWKLQSFEQRTSFTGTT